MFDVGFFWGFTFVEFEEASEDFVAEFVGPAITPRLFLFGLLGTRLVVFFLFVVEQELTASALGEVVPAVGPQHRSIHQTVDNCRRKSRQFSYQKT